MHDSKTDIEERMAIIKSSITLNSLQTEEAFVATAMKSNAFHEKAKALLMEQMKKIIDGKDPSIREVNITGFIEGINDEMIREDDE